MNSKYRSFVDICRFLSAVGRVGLLFPCCFAVVLYRQKKCHHMAGGVSCSGRLIFKPTLRRACSGIRGYSISCRYIMLIIVQYRNGVVSRGARHSQSRKKARLLLSSYRSRALAVIYHIKTIRSHSISFFNALS